MFNAPMFDVKATGIASHCVNPWDRVAVLRADEKA